MDYLILLYGLLIFLSIFIYMVAVFKPANWSDDIHPYLGFLAWMMGYVGLPVAIVISIMPMP